MANNYVQPGKILSLTTPGGGVVSGSPYKIGSLVVIATVTVTADEVTADATIKFAALVEGVVTVPKTTSGGSAFVEGAKVYWDNSASKFTGAVISDSGDVVVGVATAAAADSATTGSVRLDGVVR